MGVGLLAGLFNGLVITKVGIPSLVATLATQFLFRGSCRLCAVATASHSSRRRTRAWMPCSSVVFFDKIPMQFILTIYLVVIVVWFFLNRHRVV